MSVWQRWHKLSRDLRRISSENINSVKPMTTKESPSDNASTGTAAGPSILNVMAGSSEEPVRKVNCQTSMIEMTNISNNNSKLKF